ncbi:MAG TPA: DNA polymerase III subunit gamma/tau, partial [Bacteroidia bacterium]|nr:DNA polymerase III subunit gamma/tau [Bacteroidia bacterium]
AADMLEEEKQDMLVFLRRRTGNPALNLVIEISQTEISALPYTSKEKFESMADKNPKLRVLRNALDLEIE